MAKGEIRIGISGWTYPPWRGDFYPKGLPQRSELAYAAGLFSSVEINGTFYGLQKPESFARWAEETPDDFVFAVKGPRYLTHVRALRDIATPLDNFMASGVLRLGRKLGPILWQLPPRQPFDRELIEAFLALLPRDGEAAAACARRHDEHLKKAWLKAPHEEPLRHALEIRHDSFRDPVFLDLLREYGVALVCADTVEWPLLMDLTADFAYVRLHGSEELYESGYDAPEIERWASRVEAWAEGRPMHDGETIGPEGQGGDRSRDVYVYFDNTTKQRAPGDALALMRRLGLSSAEA